MSRLARLLGALRSKSPQTIATTAVANITTTTKPSVGETKSTAPNPTAGNDNTTATGSPPKPKENGINLLRRAIRRAETCGLPLDHYEKLGMGTRTAKQAGGNAGDDLIIGRAVRMFKNLDKLESAVVDAVDALDRDRMAAVMVECLQIGLKFPPHTDRITALLRLPALEFEQRKLQTLVKQKRWAPAIDLSMKMSLRTLHLNMRSATLARAKETSAMAARGRVTDHNHGCHGHGGSEVVDHLDGGHGAGINPSGGGPADWTPAVRRLREVVAADTTMSVRPSVRCVALRCLWLVGKVFFIRSLLRSFVRAFVCWFC